MPSGKGRRLIILHAGGVDGWVEGADLVSRSKTNSTDYHDEMNSKHYMEWMTQQLLPRLEEPTVIILDNASYHNKQKDKPPTSTDKKDDIKTWLDQHHISYSDTDIKKTLLEKVKQHRQHQSTCRTKQHTNMDIQCYAFLWPTVNSTPLS